MMEMDWTKLKENLRSPIIYTAGLAPLIVLLVMQIAHVDISGPVNTVLVLLIPVLVGFSILNDTAVRDKLFANGEQYWWQSKTMWTSLVILGLTMIKLIFGHDWTGPVSEALNYIMDIMIMLGVVKSPTSTTI